MDYITTISHKTWLVVQYVGTYQLGRLFLSWIYKIISAGSIHDQWPFPTTHWTIQHWLDGEICSFYWLCWIVVYLKPPHLHFLHANHISYIFKLGSQSAQHEQPNNTIVLYKRSKLKKILEGGKLFSSSRTKNILSNAPQTTNSLPLSTNKILIFF